MNASGYNIDRVFRRRSQLPFRTELRRHATGIPGVEFSVRPGEPRGVCDLPTSGPGVHSVYRSGLVKAVREAVLKWEEKGTLALPVGGCYEAGDNGWAVQWCTASIYY